MKKKRFTEEQIAFALAQESTGQTIAEICRRLGVSEQTFYRWKKKFGAMGHAEAVGECRAPTGCLRGGRKSCARFG